MRKVRHLTLAHLFLREVCGGDSRDATLSYVDTHSNSGDVLTKVLGEAKLAPHLRKLCLRWHRPGGIPGELPSICEETPQTSSSSLHEAPVTNDVSGMVDSPLEGELLGESQAPEVLSMAAISPWPDVLSLMSDSTQEDLRCFEPSFSTST